MDLRSDTKEHRSGGVVQKSTFARFLASFDFRLFRQHRPISDMPDKTRGPARMQALLNNRRYALSVVIFHRNVPAGVVRHEPRRHKAYDRTSGNVERDRVAGVI